MLSEAIWMDLDIVIPSEVHQTKTKAYDITDIWMLKNGTNELIYKQDESHNVENYLMVPGGRMDR